MEIRHVGIVGTGIMGSGIAGVAAQAGYRVTIVKWSSAGSLAESREKFVSSAAKSPGGHTVAMQRIVWTEERAALADCDLVIESIVEDEDAKLDCFIVLDSLVRAEAVFATNTSTLALDELAIRRSDRFLSLHFFNPVPQMRLVEVAVTDATRTDALEAVLAFLKALGKEAVIVPATPGYVVNRLFMAQAIEALRMLVERPCGETVSVLDACIPKGLNHPMGPCRLMDLIGLDVIYAMAIHLQEGLRAERFSPPTFLDRMVEKGWLGRKSGLGFYDYSDRKNPRPNPDFEKIFSLA